MALDLKELGGKLDKSLANETKFSLLRWLYMERLKNKIPYRWIFFKVDVFNFVRSFLYNIGVYGNYFVRRFTPYGYHGFKVLKEGLVIKTKKYSYTLKDIDKFLGNPINHYCGMPVLLDINWLVNSEDKKEGLLLLFDYNYMKHSYNMAYSIFHFDLIKNKKGMYEIHINNLIAYSNGIVDENMIESYFKSLTNSNVYDHNGKRRKLPYRK